MIESVFLQSALGSTLVGCSGIIPLLFASRFTNVSETKWMKLILAFGAGSLLGDAFLHLLPEVIGYSNWPYGVLIGYMFGVLVQKLALVDEDVHVQGAYINLLANCLDNFTHGLAIGGSFMIDSTTGLTTTASILIHEIPHEFGDFAILIRGGLSIKRAAILQFITAVAGVLGSLFVVFLNDISPDSILNIIVPFTIGAFLFISLSNILPELIEQKRYLKEIFVSVLLGCSTMGIVTLLTHH